MLKTTRRHAVVAAAAATLALSALSLTACSGSAGSSENELTIWSLGAADTAQSKSYAETLKAFEAAHPDVNVKFEVKTWDQMQKSGQMVLNSNEAPDVLEYPKGNASAGSVAKVGLLTDLTEVAKSKGWTDLLPPSLLNVGMYDDRGLMGNGALFGVPTYAEYVSVFYNKDVLADAGFEAPTTMDELEKQLAYFTGEGVTPLALGGADYPIVHLAYELALSQADQEWVNNFQFFTGDVDFHDKAWTYAADKVVEWKDKGYIGSDATGIDADGAAGSFKTGASPYFVSGNWWVSDFDANAAFDWGTFPFPGSGLTAASGGHVWVVPTNSTQKDLAYEWIDALLTPDSQTALANYGGVPVVAPELSEVTNEVGKLATADMAKIVDNNNLAYYPDWPIAGFYDVWLAQSQALLTSTATTDEFLNHIADFYEQGKSDLGL